MKCHKLKKMNKNINKKEKHKECCPAIVKFPDNTFMWCELDKGHKCCHLALGYTWTDETNKEYKASQKDKNEHSKAMKSYMETISGIKFKPDIKNKTIDKFKFNQNDKIKDAEFRKIN